MQFTNPEQIFYHETQKIVENVAQNFSEIIDGAKNSAANFLSKINPLPKSTKKEFYEKIAAQNEETENQILAGNFDFAGGINDFFLENISSENSEIAANLENQKEKITADLSKYNLPSNFAEKIKNLPATEILQWKTTFCSAQNLMKKIGPENKFYKILENYFADLKTEKCLNLAENKLAPEKLFFLQKLIAQINFTEKYKTDQKWIDAENFVVETFLDMLPINILNKINSGQNPDFWDFTEDFFDTLGLISIVATTILASGIVAPGTIVFVILRRFVGVDIARNVINAGFGTFNSIKNMKNFDFKKMSASIFYTLLNIGSIVTKGKLAFSKEPIGRKIGENVTQYLNKNLAKDATKHTISTAAKNAGN